MTFKEIQELIKLINKSGLTEFKMKDGDFEISMRTKNYEKVKHLPATTSQQSVMPIPPVALNPATTSQLGPQTSGGLEEANVENSRDGEDNAKYLPVKSPIVGTFYRSASPEKPPYVKVGDTIEVGSVVCIVEAMKLFNEIESEIRGKIVKVIVEDAQPVEYDQVLFLVDPNG